jgi:hypothetical protein
LNIDDDALEIEDWVGYLKLCIKNNKTDIFVSKLNECTYHMHLPIIKELNEYAGSRWAEWIADDLREEFRVRQITIEENKRLKKGKK